VSDDIRKARKLLEKARAKVQEATELVRKGRMLLDTARVKNDEAVELTADAGDLLAGLRRNPTRNGRPELV
jgi:hypothetical protein